MPGAPPLLYTDPLTGELRRRRWTLVVRSGPDSERTLEIDRSPALIGGAPASILVLTDDAVSRHHVEMDVFAEGIRLRDLDSTNGTFVGNKKIRDAFVEAGDTFRIGSTTIEVQGTDEPAAPEIATDPRGVPLGAIEWLGDALAVSTSSRVVFEKLREVARSPSAVLIEGEPGVGKATCARLIHQESGRRNRPFVVVSFPEGAKEDLYEIELFGGPTPSGDDSLPGAFERASGGTLFFERVDRLPPSLQKRVLLAIEVGEVQRNGEKRRRRVDVRIVSSQPTGDRSATAIDPRLLRRLAVVRIPVAPLRQRPEDVPAMARLFLERAGGSGLALGPSLETLLATSDWPGNIDDLRRAIETATAGHEPDHPLRKALVTDVVTMLFGDVSAAAERLQMPVFALFRYLSRHEFDLDAV